MRLLIITQKVDKNDPVLGFFYRWIEEFAKWCESVIVICLEMGESSLPSNVKVMSLGKEEGRSRFKYLLRFYKYIWRERKNYDSVFVHMNHEYVLLGGLLWRVMSKRVALWYVHRKTSFGLWLSEKFVHRVFSASAEGFGIPSYKVKFVGHGISLNPICEIKQNFSGQLTLMHVGRITPIKRCELLLQAAVLLRGDFPSIKIIFVGAPITTDDKKYLKTLNIFIKEKKLESHVEFLGSMPYPMIYKELCQADATINLAPTGGMDKVVLESLSVGVPVFFTNDTFIEIVGERAKEFHVHLAKPEILAEKIRKYFTQTREVEISSITQRVREYFSIPALLSRIIENL